MQRNIVYLLFVLNLLVLDHLPGQTCCSGGVPLMGNIGLPPSESKSLQIHLSYDYNVLNDLKFENTELDDESRFRSTKSLLWQAGYAFGERFSVNGLFSYVSQVRKISQFNSVNTTETSGIGDAVITVSYKIPNLIGNNNELLLHAGPKIPLGETDNTNNDGRLIIADMQPGTGAWDMILGTGFLQQMSFRPSTSFYIRGMYRLTGTNNSYLGDQKYRFGNELQIFTGFTDQFLIARSVFEGSLGLNYRNAGIDKINGTVLANTGGDFLYVLGGVGIQLSPVIQLNVSGQLPVYSKPVGTQLVPSYRINAGLLFNFSFNDSDDMNIKTNEL